MKCRAMRIGAMLVLTGALLWLSGCGSSSPNVVQDAVVPATYTMIAGTTYEFVSTVTGSTDINSSWTCSYVYTPAPTTSVPNPKQTSPASCTSGMKVNGGSIGTWTTNQTTADNTLTYTAPSLTNFPNPIPQITFTAAAEADSKKTGTAAITLDTGIRVAVTPTSATAPVGLTPAQEIQFTASFYNVPPVNPSPTWALMQPVSGDTTDFPNGTAPGGASCSPNCGTISAQGVYTAPATMPTDTYPKSSGSNAATAAQTVYVVVNSPADTAHFAVATITLVNSSTNPIAFTGIQPTKIAAGGVLQDIFLSAKNLVNTTSITFTDPNGVVSVLDPSSQVFTIPITAAYCTPSASGVTPVVTCDASILTRIRLNQQQLATAGTGKVTVNGVTGDTSSLPGNCSASIVAGSTSVSCTLQLVYASPTIVAAVPDSYPQGVATEFSTDGGYYGGGGSALVELLFNGSLNIASAFGPRQFTGPLQGSQIPSPGLYPVSIEWDAAATEPPPPYPHVTADVAVQPVFANLASTYNPTPPPPTPTYPPNIPLLGGATAIPGSIAINSTRGYGVITEQGANAVEIVNFVANPSSPGRFMPQVGSQVAVGNQPTGVAIDDQLDLSAAGFPGQDLAVVVNSADSTLTLLALPSGQVIGSPISLAGLIQEPSGTTAPQPYSVGVDPVTHYAVVAFSNATLGFIVDVNPNPIPQGQAGPTCFVSTQKVPCAIASVSLNTGSTPQVVIQPGAPLAYVTPGGAGVTSVVNLLLTNNTVAIAASPNGAIRTNNVVTITTPTPNGLNPSSPGAVLIQGVTPADLNGTYNVTSATTYTFTYSQAGPNETGGGGSITYGNPYYTFNTTPTAVGGAVNPVTRTFAFADPNASTSAPQIAFIPSLDQNITSLDLTRGSCNGCKPSPPGAPETGLRFVAWDPYTYVLIADNPQDNFNEISLINPGGPTATGVQFPYRIIAAIATGQTGAYTPSGSSTPTAFGSMAYDPKTNLVLAVNAESNTLTYLDLDPGSTFKKVSIRDVQLQLIPYTNSPNSGGVATAQPPLASAPNAPSPLPMAICDPTAPTNIYATCLPHGVTVGQPAYLRVLGQGFLSAGSPTVRLDGDSTGITITNSTDTEVDVTVAASRLTKAHDFALDVVSGSVNSNTNDLYAVQITPLPPCGTTTAPIPAQPEGVAYDDIQNVAAVTNYACNTVSFINMDSANVHNYGVPYGGLLATVNVGTNPIGVAMIPRLGYAVVANNADSSASIIQYGGSPFAAKELSFTSASCTTASGTTSSTNICVGVAPTGVAIDQDRALALVANSGGSSISAVDLTPLLLATPGTPPMQIIPTSGPPKAIAVDPNRAVAVVTNVLNQGTATVSGGLDVINLASTPPSKNNSASIGTLTANPTGIVYDPVPSPALFYVTSTQQNAIYAFNPDTSSTPSLIRVGVNPYSVAYNYQTGTLLSVNSTSNTSSVIDAVNAPVFATREMLGISSQSQFAGAIDNFTNTAILADQNNNRVVILPLK